MTGLGKGKTDIVLLSLVFSFVYLKFSLHKKCPYLEFSGPYLLAFRLTTETYRLNCRIRS